MDIFMYNHVYKKTMYKHIYYVQPFMQINLKHTLLCTILYMYYVKMSRRTKCIF